MAFCTQCGTTMPDSARFCPSCGAAADATATATPGNPATAPAAGPAKGGMILPLMVLVALVVIGLFLYSQRKPAATTTVADTADSRTAAGGSAGGSTAAPAAPAAAPAGTLPSISVARVDADFHADPGAAGLRYASPFRAMGLVSVGASGGPNPSISLEGRSPFNFAIAQLPLAPRAQLDMIAKGQSILLRCASATALAGTTILKGCTIE